MGVNRNPDLGPDLARAAFDERYAQVYSQLKALAAGVMRQDRQSMPMLTPTMLVHEAWLKLHRTPGLAGTSRAHFFNLAASAMRQVLVELVRNRKAAKRDPGGPSAIITFNDDEIAGPASLETCLLIDSALERLADTRPHLAKVVELRFFAGLSHAEVAEALGVTVEEAARQWREAKLFLYRLMKPEARP
jgi:RNA polymerase sigma factor (TIGR02999 family)